MRNEGNLQNEYRVQARYDGGGAKILQTYDLKEALDAYLAWIDDEGLDEITLSMADDIVLSARREPGLTPAQVAREAMQVLQNNLIFADTVHAVADTKV